MLKEHTGKKGSSASTGDNVLEPDTFWSLIEKLLLRSSIDGQARHQHNLALSAMCRGHALPCLPRRVKRTKLKTGQDIPKEGGVKAEEIVQEKQIPVPNESTSVQFKEIPEGVKIGTTPITPQDVTKAQSECFVNELDVEYVKDSKIPASERLWRYAMRHSKEKTDANIEPNVPECIPSARSNEAIYHALKQRLDEALNEKSKREMVPKKKKVKLRMKAKALPRTCKSLDRNDKRVLKVKQPSRPTSLPFNSTEKMQPIPKGRVRITGLQVPKVPLKLNGSSTSQSVCVSSTKHEEIESNRALYDCVLKKRLNCGNQLETLNKEIVYKKNNPRTIINRETTKKYAELKNEYLNLCFQECKLRHQIAILQAEIYMMQNKGFHKTPASIKTINLDSSTANLRPEMDYSETHPQTQKKESSDVLLFPRLKAPKPLLVCPPKYQADKYKLRNERRSGDMPEDGEADQEEQSDNPLPYIMDGLPTHCVCSVYSLSPQLTPPPKRAPVMSVEAKLSRDKSMTKLSHRLPKMSTVNLLKMASKS